MSKTIEGMVAASMEGANHVIWEAEKRGLCPATTEMNIAAQKAALLWLADNVSDEMEKALVSCKDERGWKPSISAALRAAAGDGR